MKVLLLVANLMKFVLTEFYVSELTLNHLFKLMNTSLMEFFDVLIRIRSNKPRMCIPSWNLHIFLMHYLQRAFRSIKPALSP
jgi:hypothetical protein